jgi:hypothetical protein
MKIQQIKDKALRDILSQIVSSLNNEIDIEDLIDDYEKEFSELYLIIESELRSLGIDSDMESITYVIALLVENPNFENLDELLVRPTLESYEVTHVYERRLTVEVTYLTEFKSYIPITADIVRDLESESLYYGADGEKIDEEVTDSEWIDDWVESVE